MECSIGMAAGYRPCHWQQPAQVQSWRQMLTWQLVPSYSSPSFIEKEGPVFWRLSEGEAANRC